MNIDDINRIYQGNNVNFEKNNETRNRIKSMRNQGKSVAFIADTMGCSEETVKELLDYKRTNKYG